MSTDPSVRTEAVRLYESGIPSREVGVRLGVGKSTVLRWVTEAGVPRRAAGRVADLPAHGNVGGYTRHIKRGTAPCEECLQAHRAYQAGYLAGATRHMRRMR